MSTVVNKQELIKREIEKCKNDIVYFVRKYVKIQHPVKRVIPFDLYPIQEKLLKFYQEHKYVITEKPRQMGVTWTAVAFALHQIIFKSDYQVLIVANKEETAKNVLSRIKFSYEHLPKFLQLKRKVWNKKSIVLSNRSSAKAISSRSDSGRSESITLLIVEEAAFIPNMDELWASVQQTLATGGKCIVNSTYNGIGNWYEITVRKAKNGENEFKYFPISWRDHPERDENWFREQQRLLPPRVFAQEVLCTPVGSGENVIDLSLIREEEFKDPVRTLWGGEYWEWERESGIYFMSVDPAGGKGEERSAIGIQVLCVDPLSLNITQVAEFSSDKTPIPTLRYIIKEIYNIFKPQLTFVETNGIGLGLFQYLESFTPNLVGYHTTRLKKIHGADLLAKLYQDKKLVLRSKRLLDQLYKTTWVKGKVVTSGRDDLFMALINCLMAISTNEIMEANPEWDKLILKQKSQNNLIKVGSIVEEFGSDFRYVIKNKNQPLIIPPVSKEIKWYI